MTFRSSVQAAVLMAIGAAAGCTVTNSSSDGGSSSCKADSTVTSCTQGTGWSCDPTDTNSPADGNPLVCSRAVASSSGDKIEYCCVASTGVSSNCSEDSAVTCQQGTGFSCTGASTPDQT